MKTFAIGASNERLTKIHCNLCGGARTESFLGCEGFSYVQCTDCGLVYQDPQPVFEDLRKRYAERYFEYELENEKNFFELMFLGLNDIRFFDLPLERFEVNRFLDIGCATGMLLSRMKSLGWRTQGVEICRESAEYGMNTRGVDISVGTLEEAGFASGSFSAVHFSHLIEHVPEPLGFLREVHRVLTGRGIVIVTTPNVDGFQARWLKTRWRSAIADHLTLFSRSTLRRMLSEVGFRVKRSVTWGGIAKGLAPPLIKRPLDFLAKRFGFGDVVLFLAEKDG